MNRFSLHSTTSPGLLTITYRNHINWLPAVRLQLIWPLVCVIANMCKLNALWLSIKSMVSVRYIYNSIRTNLSSLFCHSFLCLWNEKWYEPPSNYLFLGKCYQLCMFSSSDEDDKREQTCVGKILSEAIDWVERIYWQAFGEL